MPFAERVSLENMTPPFAVMIMPPAVEDPEWGITNQTYMQDVTFAYVMRLDLVTDPEEAVAAKAETLEDRLLSVPLTLGQVIRTTVQDPGAENVINALILDKQKPFHAGIVTAQILVGETNQ